MAVAELAVKKLSDKAIAANLKSVETLDAACSLPMLTPRNAVNSGYTQLLATYNRQASYILAGKYGDELIIHMFPSPPLGT
jgi:hypothetical protein